MPFSYIKCFWIEIFSELLQMYVKYFAEICLSKTVHKLQKTEERFNSQLL